ncbi:monocarboxylate transporter 9-like [Saccoglossus kowalevskii]|uniref:Monocarboxylate transporter 13-like n=1 Tax=Saccoglossus kowalevskii TaxID=10224 RepID=A0ABM0MAY7_SACKO|nr:PREDICTED: monocarboxylate transporter 13-like [Saccoglossus kowalevskii]
MGIPKMNASILMSMIGLSSFVGRCTHRLLANLRYVPPKLVYVFNTTVEGTVLMLLPLTKGNYNYMAIISLLFRLCNVTYFPLAAVCVKQSVGVDSFPKAFGWFLLCLGTGISLDPYLGGLMIDVTYNYDVSFLVAGGCLLSSGSILGAKLLHRRIKAGRHTNNTYKICTTVDVIQTQD